MSKIVLGKRGEGVRKIWRHLGGLARVTEDDGGGGGLKTRILDDVICERSQSALIMVLGSGVPFMNNRPDRVFWPGPG